MGPCSTRSDFINDPWAKRSNPSQTTDNPGLRACRRAPRGPASPNDDDNLRPNTDWRSSPREHRWWNNKYVRDGPSIHAGRVAEPAEICAACTYRCRRHSLHSSIMYPLAVTTLAPTSAAGWQRPLPQSPGGRGRSQQLNSRAGHALPAHMLWSVENLLRSVSATGDSIKTYSIIDIEPIYRYRYLEATFREK